MRWFCKLLLLLALTPSAQAVMSGNDEPPQAGAPATPYQQGVAAHLDENWSDVIRFMAEAIAEQPWNDDAHNLIGHAYRKLGDYDQSLDHYQTALQLNPYHRGALEYLGEAYLEMGRINDARHLLDRLEQECRRLFADNWKAECEEWQDLDEAFTDR